MRAVLSAAGMAIIAGGAIMLASASAADGSRPSISGEPIVGHLLTSSPGPTGQALYRWQRCDPTVADCSDSLEHNDPNWTDLTRPSHTGQTYTIPPADLGHFVRVLVHDNDTGDKWTSSVPVGPVREGPPPPAEPPPPIAPEHGVSFLVEPVSGSVRIKPPGQKTYSPLNGLTKIPVNSVVDTRGGKVELTAATGDLGDTTRDQSVQFYDGLIRIQQAGDTNAMATAKLVEKLRCPKGSSQGATAGKSGGPVASTAAKRRRRVWGSGTGSYGTAGRGGTGSVRGTTWLTKDTCRGTFFKVTDGIGITVSDFDRGKRVELGPGQSYFARNR